MAKVPIVARKKLLRIGGSVLMTLPLEWFKAHGYGNTIETIMTNLEDVPDFLVLADNDVRIVNPNHRKKVEAELYEGVSGQVDKAQIERLRYARKRLLGSGRR